MGGPTEVFSQSLQALQRQFSKALLDLDPALQQQLTPLAGQTIEVQCLQPQTTWHWVIEPTQIDFIAEPATNPAVVIRGSAQDLLQAAMTGNTGWPLEIQGDATVLLRLQALIKQFSPDLAGPLSALIGNEEGQRGAALVEFGVSALKDIVSAAHKEGHHAAEAFLAKRYTSEADGNALYDRLSALRLRVDRLQARLDLFTSPETKR